MVLEYTGSLVPVISSNCSLVSSGVTTRYVTPRGDNRDKDAAVMDQDTGCHPELGVTGDSRQ